MIHRSDTVKLANFKRLTNRIESNTSRSRRTALEIFNYFFWFFVISSVRFDRTRLQNELNIGYEDDEFCSLDRFDRTELFTKKQYNNLNIRKSSVRFAVTKSNWFDWIRFNSISTFSSQVSLYACISGRRSYSVPVCEIFIRTTVCFFWDILYN